MKKLFMMFLFFCSIVFSQENLMDLTLEELLNIEVTTASKSAQKSSMAPATIVVISDEQIKTRGYRSLQDLLIDLPAINISKGADPRWYNPTYIRGLGEQEKFIILLNGIKISSPTGEMLPIIENYPVYLAKQIEIIYGPASALYGADAVTGVINIITKENNDNSLDLSVTGGIFNSINTNAFYTKKLSSEAKLNLGFQYYYEQGPKMYEFYKDPMDFGNAKEFLQNPTFNGNALKTPVSKDFEMPIYAYNAFANLKIDNFTFTYFGNYARHSSALGDKPNGDAIYNKDVYFAQYINVFDARYNVQINNNISNITSVTFSRYDLDKNSNFRNKYVALEPAYKYSYGAMGKIENQINYNYNDQLSFILGVFFENYYSLPKGADLEYPVKTDENISGIIKGTIQQFSPNGIKADFFILNYYNTGSYFQTQYTPTEDLSITAGLRYDYNSRFKESFNPRLGLVYKVTPKTTIKALYGSAFLAVPPRVEYDYYGSFYTTDNGKTFASYFWHLPNPGIKPVKAQTFEIGLKSYLTEAFGFSVNSFYAVYNDLYGDELDTKLYNNTYLGYPVATIVVSTNKDKQTNYGGEVELNYLYKIDNTNKVLFYVSGSYVDGFMNNKAPNGKKYQIGNVVPLMFKGGFDLTYSDFTISPRFIYNSKSRLNTPKNSTEEKMKEIDGYFILNLAAKYKINNNMSILLNVQNLTDARYYAIGPLNPDKGQPQRPIQIMGGVEINL